MATRTLEIQWTELVTKADPDWRREHGHPPQLPDEDLPIKRQLVTQDWRHRGAYAGTAGAEESSWILATGLWRDTGLWADSAVWID